MKKNIWLIVPVILVLTITIIVLFQNRKKIFPIIVTSWDSKDEFLLCKIEADNVTNDEDGCFFYPKDKDAFIEEIIQIEGYLGNTFTYYCGVKSDKSHLFYYNDNLYAVMEYGGGYMLWSCMCDFSYIDNNSDICRYRYLSLTEFRPSNAYNDALPKRFDEYFVSFEESVKLYGHLSEEIVKYSEEDQQIRFRIYDTKNEKIIDDKCVCIDFNAKDVYVEEGITW